MSLIFLSHSSGNREQTDAIATLLEREYTSLFLDFDPVHGIPAGRNWEREIYAALRRSAVVLLLLSPEWNASKWCFAEARLARSLGKRVISVKIAPCDMDVTLAVDQAIDLTGPHRDAEHARLFAALKAAGLDASRGFVRDPARPPYPGLAAFDAKDAALYFGRDDEIRTLQEKLEQLVRFRTVSWLLVLGASGSGKSSLMRAGILPRLRDDWIVVGPIRAVNGPLEAMAEALVHAKLPGTPATVRAKLDTFADLVRELRTTLRRPEATVVVALDQFEEFLDGSAAAEQTLRFLKDAPVVVLATLRSDYLAKFQAHPLLGKLEFESLPLAELTSDRFAEVIAKPAELAGFDVDPELVPAMVSDTATGDALPLLAFTLRELWEHDKAGQRLTYATYDKVLKRLEGALVRSADAALSRATPAELEAVRRTFLLLVRPGEGSEYRRQHVPFAALSAAARPLVDRLVAARLLVADADGVEVAHEALFRAWPRLVKWLGDEKKFLEWRERLEFAHAEWLTAKKAWSERLRDAGLAEAQTWLGTHGDLLPQDQRHFVKLSGRIQRWTRLVLGAVILGVGLFVVFLWRRATAEAEDARAQRRAITVSLARSFFEQGQRVFEDEHDVVKAMHLVAKALELAPEGDEWMPVYANRLAHLSLVGPVMTGSSLAAGVLDAAIARNGTSLLVVGADHVPRFVTFDASNPERGMSLVRTLDFEVGDAALKSGVAIYRLSPDGRWVALLLPGNPRTSIRIFDAGRAAPGTRVSSSFTQERTHRSTMVFGKRSDRIFFPGGAEGSDRQSLAFRSGSWGQETLPEEVGFTETGSALKRLKDAGGAWVVSVFGAELNVTLPLKCCKHLDTNDAETRLVGTDGRTLHVWSSMGLQWKRELPKEPGSFASLIPDREADRVLLTEEEEPLLFDRERQIDAVCNSEASTWLDAALLYACRKPLGGVELLRLLPDDVYGRANGVSAFIGTGLHVKRTAQLAGGGNTRLLTLDETGRLAVFDTTADAALVTSASREPPRQALFAGENLVLLGDSGVSWSSEKGTWNAALPKSPAERRLIPSASSRFVGVWQEEQHGSSMRVLDGDRRTTSEPVPSQLSGLGTGADSGTWSISNEGIPVADGRLADGLGSFVAGFSLPGGGYSFSSDPLGVVALDTFSMVPIALTSQRAASLVWSHLSKCAVGTEFNASPGVEFLSCVGQSGGKLRVHNAFGESALFFDSARGRTPIRAPSARDRTTTGAVLSDDGRFVASLEGSQAIVWSADGYFVTEDLAHPSEILDAHFLTRDGVMYLETIAKDGVLRRWFVYEDFKTKPLWAAEVARLAFGTKLADDGTEQMAPGYMEGPARAALFATLRAEKGVAASVLRKKFLGN